MFERAQIAGGLNKRWADPYLMLAKKKAAEEPKAKDQAAEQHLTYKDSSDDIPAYQAEVNCTYTLHWCI